jgi:hypothetical protein
VTPSFDCDVCHGIEDHLPAAEDVAILVSDDADSGVPDEAGSAAVTRFGQILHTAVSDRHENTVERTARVWVHGLGLCCSAAVASRSPVLAEHLTDDDARAGGLAGDRSGFSSDVDPRLFSDDR